MESLERIGDWLAGEYRKNGMKWLTGIGYTSIVASPILAAFGAIRAYKEIEKRKKERNVEQLPLKETAGIVAMNAAAPVIVTAAAIASTAKVQNTLIAKNDALTTAVVLGENKLRELKEAEKETVGEEKAKEIQDKAKNKVVEKTDAGDVFYDIEKGEYPCMDSMTGQIFQSSEAKVQAAINIVNRNSLNGQNTMLSEFLESCGGRVSDLGDMYVWPASKKADYSVFTDFRRDLNGRALLVIEYPDNELILDSDPPF